MESILKGLNAAQRAAVTSPASILQVLAPPGSGKTKTLTSRVAYLLAHHGFAPRNVICCTFTIKASREMRERLRGMIGCELESKLILGTFHSICRRYLVAYGNLIGLPRSFGIADSSDSLSIIKRAVKKLNLSIDPRVARSKISHRKARGQRLEDIPKTATKNVDQQEFVQIFQEYETALRTSNLLDYDDLLLRCTDLLKAYPHCVSNVEAILIDEFQDTNVVQFELMKLLASSKKVITIVGDPDQSIYGFRSAEIENLRKMRAHYPDAVVINLEENYRSSSAVLQLAQDVIEQDSNRPDKKLVATHPHGTLPVLRRLPNPHEEAQWIISEIKRMTAMTGGLLQYSDFAILLRSAFLSLLIEKALGSAGMPYKMVGGHRFFDRVEVRLVIDYLRTISAPDNNSALLAIINVPARKIGETTIKELVRVSEDMGLSLWATVQKVLLNELPLDKKLSKPAEQNLRKLVSIIKDGRKKVISAEPGKTPQALIEYVISAIDLKGYLRLKYSDDHEDRWENVQELHTQATDMVVQQQLAADEKLPEIDGLRQQDLNSSEEVLARFLANITLSTEVEENEEDAGKPRITISTIHSAKGLEWPVVFVPAVHEGQIPHTRAEDTDEERRLLYVAMTRAQALLSLTFPVMQSREMGESILSQFLPQELHLRLCPTGPNFTDKVVGDIASILRRPTPSQADLVRGLQSLSDKDSASDDIWPVDGSHRVRADWGRDFATAVSGRVGFESASFSEATSKFRDAGPWASSGAPKTTNFVGQGRRLMSTGSMTMSDSKSIQFQSFPAVESGFDKSNDRIRSESMQPSWCFETANDRMKAEKATNLEFAKNLSPAITTNTKPEVKGKRLDHGQRSISKFFGRRPSASANPAQHPFRSIGRQISNWAPPAITHDLELPEITPIPTSTHIPAELSSHRLTTKAAPFKRPRAAVEEVPSPNRKRYVFLSSSPARETAEPCTSAIVVDENSQTTKSLYKISTTTNTVLVRSNMRPASTMHTTSMAMLQQNGAVRKTLGVRRTMNGWDNRKNK